MSSSAEPPDHSPGEIPSPRWARLFRHADHPLFVLNARRQLLYANPAWERWAGIALTEVRGRPCRPSKSTEPDATLLGSLAPTKESLAGEPSSVRRRDAAARSLWFDIHFFPLTKDGRVAAILGRIEPVQGASPSKELSLSEPIAQLRERSAQDYRLELWESDVPTVQTAVAQARLASQITVPVVLRGPTGCGKEWLARAIHRLGPRREEFFACLDPKWLAPSMLADLLLQSTTRLNLGAILLRNPADLRPEMQDRLAELLGEEKFGPRLFVAITDDTEAARMSPSLLARVNMLTIHVPPLAERRSDWPRLLPSLLARSGAAANKRIVLSPDAEQILRLHSWPGNFRELDQTLRDAALHATGERIELTDLPFTLRSDPPPQEPKLPLDDLLQNAERRLIALALDQSRNNQSKAAQILGISRARIARRMEQLGIAGAAPPGGPADAER